jgi:hypothetical protein
MMHLTQNIARKNRFHFLKLSFLPLFFLLHAEKSTAIVAFRDTIVLDSLVVEIQPEWDIDTVYQDRSEVRKLFRHLDLEAGFTGGKVNVLSEVRALQTPEEFTNNKASWLPNPFAGIDLALGNNPSYYFRTGLRLSRQGWNHSYFDEAELDDSLYRFELNESGSIDQILLFRYQGLGSETDTIPLVLKDAKVRYWTIDIPIRFCYRAEVERSNSTIEVSLGIINRFRLAAKTAQVSLINEKAERDYVDQSEEYIKTFGLLGNAGVAWNWRPKRDSWAIGIRTDFSVPLQSEVSSSKFAVQRVESNIGLFFRIFL